MQSFKSFLEEKRRNPHLNPRLSAMAQLEKYVKSYDYFITFTMIEKVGIKPMSTFGTPLGIYAYPLKDAIDFYQIKEPDDFPFAGNRPFIQVLKKKKGKILNLGKYTKAKAKADKEAVDKLIDPKTHDGRYIVLGNDPGQYIWNYTQSASDGNITKWANLFQKLGYIGVIDPGKAIIHPNEKMQAVFFSKSAIEHVETIRNTKEVNVKSTISIDEYLKRIDDWAVTELYTKPLKIVAKLETNDGDYKFYPVPTFSRNKFQLTETQIDLLIKAKRNTGHSLNVSDKIGDIPITTFSSWPIILLHLNTSKLNQNQFKVYHAWIKKVSQDSFARAVQFISRLK